MIPDFSRRGFLLGTLPAAALTSAVARTVGAAAPVAGRPPIKVGQIGVGHSHAAGKMQVLRESTEWDVVGVVESDPQLRAQAQQDDVYRDLPWLTAEQLFNTPGLQAVAVETTVDQLLNTAHQCVAAGMHIHLDKPPGDSLPRFRQLLSLADSQNLVVQMGYMYRYNPAIVLLRDLLTKGWLGEVFELHAVMSKAVGKSKRQTWAEAPGGTMFELGCHLIDLMVVLLGKPEQVTPYNLQSGEFDDSLQDNMLAVCNYPRATATIRSTALEVEGFDRRHLAVCGTRGTCHIQPLDAPNVQLALDQPRGKYQAGYQQIPFGDYARYVADLADLAAIVRGEKASDFNSAHDLAAHETLLRACELPCD
jgi:predicted dehydrogenase